MSIEAMKQALEALEELHRTGDTQVFDLCYAPKVIPALRTAIEAAEKQEPHRLTSWGFCSVCKHDKIPGEGCARKDCPEAPAAQRQWVGLTERETELLDGMIAVQLDHAARCDGIANRTMAEKQKGWDMERVTLLQKIKATPPAAPAAPLQVSPTDFVDMVMDKEDAIGKPLFWAEWPNKEKNHE